MKIKICGITNLADARYAAAAGADYLGFVQYRKSPRFLEPSSAKEIIDWVFGSSSVGIFVNETPEEVNRISDLASFELVQLHGSETVAICKAINRPVIKAFRIRPGTTVDDMRRQMTPFAEAVEYFLLDAFDEAEPGGTGKRVDWNLAHTLASEFPLFLAGGLNPKNAVQAAQTVQPFALDVSSGLESEPGRKDFGKIDAFFVSLDEHSLLGEEV